MLGARLRLVRHNPHAAGVRPARATPVHRPCGWRPPRASSALCCAQQPGPTHATVDVRHRLPNLLDWLREASPDVVCLQELKAADAEFPAEATKGGGIRGNLARPEELGWPSSQDGGRLFVGGYKPCPQQRVGRSRLMPISGQTASVELPFRLFFVGRRTSWSCAPAGSTEDASSPAGDSNLAGCGC